MQFNEGVYNLPIRHTAAMTDFQDAYHSRLFINTVNNPIRPNPDFVLAFIFSFHGGADKRIMRQHIKNTKDTSTPWERNFCNFLSRTPSSPYGKSVHIVLFSPLRLFLFFRIGPTAIIRYRKAAMRCVVKFLFQFIKCYII